MTIRPLPEIDLARIAPLQLDQKRRELNRFHLGRPRLSYDPLRQSISDIMHAKAGMLDVPLTPWNRVADVIVKKCRSTAEETANLEAAEGLYNFAREKDIRSRRHDFLPLALGVNRKVVYWHSIILINDGIATVPFFDPRRSPRLTADARRFVFSTMHERIRVGDPELANVRLAIFQFPPAEEGPREPIVFTDQNIELFSFDELGEMVRETYELWQEISQDREDGMRRRTSGRGSLL